MAAFDPFHDECDLRTGENFAFGRHFRIGSLLDAVHHIRGGVAGFDDLS